LLAALQHLTPATRKALSDVGIDVTELIKRAQPKSGTPLQVFDSAKKPEAEQALQLNVFSASGQRVIHLLQAETEGLGYAEADPRHLLLALLEYEGGATHLALHQQAISPKKIQEAVMLSLRSRARKTRSHLSLDRAHLQQSVQRILEWAGEHAGQDQSPVIAEAHILRAFLSVDTYARRLLQDEKVDLDTMRATAEQYDIADEPAPTVTSGALTIEEIRQLLEQAIVGQPEVIERCLPFIKRMRFGMPRRRRPAGVFLFCGQSGSGKTEMAKVIARAIYGSEEYLIMLEMGQFQTKESMNIFVGAPPGYVGYGEGKLTNGLRDKPRAVVLFDEVEKAHPEVYHALLRFLDEGKIDDPAGPVRDGSQCLIILTSNVAAESLSKLWAKVENSPDARWQLHRLLRAKLLKHRFRIEFLNRVDEIVLFRTLSKDDLAEITRRQLTQDAAWLRKEKQIELQIDSDVYTQIGEFCHALEEGARAVLRMTQLVVLNPVIDFLDTHPCIPPVQLRVQCTRGSEGCEPVGQIDFLTTNAPSP
jgi:ATP-dependent Clp protease ATP-binding subunit ClpC